MGQWNISIHGSGSHHNKNYPADANRMAADFVRQLRAKGHTVTKATITYGAEEDVTTPRTPEEESEAYDDPTK